MKNRRGNTVKKFVAGITAACLIAGTLPTSVMTAFAEEGWDDPYAYNLSQDSLIEAIEEAVDGGSLLYEKLDFSGDYAYEYEDLFYQDGTLYELSLDAMNLAGSADRDSVLDLRAFVRISEDAGEAEDIEDDAEAVDAEEAVEDAGYTVNGSEKVIFLLQNRSEEEVTAKIYLDGKESHRIVVLPHDEIIPPETSEDADAADTDADDGESYEVLVIDDNLSEPAAIDSYEVEIGGEDSGDDGTEAEGPDPEEVYTEAAEPEGESAPSEETYEPEDEQAETPVTDEEAEEEIIVEEDTAEDADTEEEPEEEKRVLPEESPIDPWKLLDGTIYDPVCVGDNGAAAFGMTLDVKNVNSNDIVTLSAEEEEEEDIETLAAVEAGDDEGQVIDGYGTITVTDQQSGAVYTVNINDVPTNTNISLSSTNIVITDVNGETVSGISLTGKLYFVPMGSEEDTKMEEWKPVSYFKLDGNSPVGDAIEDEDDTDESGTDEGDTEDSDTDESVTDESDSTQYFEVVPYGEDSAFDMSEGSLYLRNASVVSARADIMPIQAEMLCEQDGYGDDSENTGSGYTQTFIGAKEMTGNPQVFYYPGYEDDVIEMSVLTNGRAEVFYWGSIGDDGGIDGLHEYEYAKIVNIGENTAGAEVYYLYPSDADGNVPDGYDHDTSKLYMKYDEIYSFDVILNSIVNELTEDNGDVYLWKGTTYYVDQYHNMGGTSNGYTNYAPSPSNNWDSGVWDQLALGKANGSYENGEASFDGEGREYAINNGKASFSDYKDVSPSDAGDVIRQSGTNKISTSSSRKYGIVGPYTVEGGATDVTTSKVRITGHIGDKFTPMEAFGESRVYLVTDEDEQLHSDWIDIGARPSDGGTRSWWYWINDYYKLNNYDDELEFIEIAEREDEETGEMQVRLEADEVGESEDALEEYDIWDAKLFIKRESVIKTDMLDNKSDYTSDNISFQTNAGRPHHIQLRMNGNFETVLDGVTYSGELSVLSDEDADGNVNEGEGSKAPYVKYTVPYTDGDGNIKLLTESAYLGIDNEQESKIHYFGGASGSSYYVPNDLIFDTDYVQIHARIYFTGTITSTNGDKYEYTVDNPFIYENDLTENELREAYDACPNKAGYDLAVNLADALISEVDVEPEIILYKIWDDDDNARGSRGTVDEVDVNLERSEDGETWETVYDKDDPTTVAEFIIPAPRDEDGNIDGNASQWSLVLSEDDLDLSYPTDDGGKAFYEFRISKEELKEGEETAEGFTYNTTIVGTTVTNTLVHDTDTIEGEKLWYGDNGKELADIPVDNVIITLYQDGHYL